VTAFVLRPRALAFVVIVAVTVSVAGAVDAAAPAPFPMPLDSGTRYVKQAAAARADLAQAQPEVTRTRQLQQRLQAQFDDLNGQVAALDGQEKAAAAQVDAARARIAGVAARQYVEAGGTRVNAALEAALNANDLLDLGRNLHILEKSGTFELDVFTLVDAQHTAIVQHLNDVTTQRDGVKGDLDDAAKRVKNLLASLDGARRSLAEAQDGIARFFRAATTSASPIMGPIRLPAGALAAFVRAHGGKPNLSVSIDELARMYIEEGEKVGVRGDVAFAQSILETGWFEFSKSMVDPRDNNFAGIGACDTCKRGFSFPSARLGVRAQMQLLRVYVDREVAVNSLPDPLLLPGTLRLGFRGRVQTWWDLTGRWATASNYGNAVYDLYNRVVAAGG
jgi:Mannosyl-glycoprotein endo-beta-N-acetylglucosaminidase